MAELAPWSIMMNVLLLIVAGFAIWNAVGANAEADYWRTRSDDSRGDGRD